MHASPVSLHCCTRRLLRLSSLNVTVASELNQQIADLKLVNCPISYGKQADGKVAALTGIKAVSEPAKSTRSSTQVSLEGMWEGSQHRNNHSGVVVLLTGFSA